MTEPAVYFDELTAGPPVSPERARWLRAQLESNDDLGSLVRRVLVDERPTDGSTLGQHRRVSRINAAAHLLDWVAADEAFAIIAAASRGSDPGVLHVIAPRAHELARRAPRLWPRLIDDAHVGLVTIRWLLARLESAPDVAAPLRDPLIALAKRGLVPMYVYGILAREGSREAHAVVAAAAANTGFPDETRVLALRADGTAELARALVEAGTHASSRSLVLTVYGLLERAGLDAAFAAGEGERVFAGARELGAMIARIMHDARKVDVGLAPMHAGAAVTFEDEMRLQRSRDQVFVVGGEPVWTVRYYHLDDREDPNHVKRMRPLDASEPTIADERLRPGPHERRTVRVAPVRREAGAPHPFADVWEADPYPGDDDDDETAEAHTLNTHAWRAVAPRVELVFLPLRESAAAAPATERTVTAYAWAMPGSKLDGPLYVYAIVLRGEAVLDAAARSGEALDVELVFPIATPFDRRVAARF